MNDQMKDLQEVMERHYILLEIPSEQTEQMPLFRLFAQNYNTLSLRDLATITLGTGTSLLTIFEDITPNEIADVEASRHEIARGESRTFDNVEDTFAWLDSDDE